MELAEVNKTIEELKGRFDAPFGSSDKSTIEYLYYEVTGKTFVPTSCQQCYHDGLIEIYHYIKKYGKMAEKSKEQLKAEKYFKQNGIECDKNFVYGIN